MKKRKKTLPVVLRREFKWEAMWGFSRSIARWKANELFFQEPSSLKVTTSVLASIFANFRVRPPFFNPFFLLPSNTVNVTVQATTKFGERKKAGDMRVSGNFVSGLLRSPPHRRLISFIIYFDRDTDPTPLSSSFLPRPSFTPSTFDRAGLRRSRPRLGVFYAKGKDQRPRHHYDSPLVSPED